MDSLARLPKPWWVQVFVRRRVTATIIIGILLAVRIVRNSIPTADPLSITDLVGVASCFLIVCGLAMRSWAAAQLHKGTQLATGGPYALCRHPLYLGTLLVIGGFCLLIRDPLTSIALLATILIFYTPTLAREESGLARRFGEAWDRYSQATPRLLPLGKPAGWGPVSFAQWRTNAEYQMILGAALGVLALDFWTQLLSRGH